MKKRNWRTTLLGLCTILAAVGAAGKALLDGDPGTTVDMPILLAQVTAGVGLLLARDAKVTSKSLGLE